MSVVSFEELPTSTTFTRKESSCIHTLHLEKLHPALEEVYQLVTGGILNQKPSVELLAGVLLGKALAESKFDFSEVSTMLDKMWKEKLHENFWGQIFKMGDSVGLAPMHKMGLLTDPQPFDTLIKYNEWALKVTNQFMESFLKYDISAFGIIRGIVNDYVYEIIDSGVLQSIVQQRPVFSKFSAYDPKNDGICFWSFDIREANWTVFRILYDKVRDMGLSKSASLPSWKELMKNRLPKDASSEHFYNFYCLSKEFRECLLGSVMKYHAIESYINSMQYQLIFDFHKSTNNCYGDFLQISWDEVIYSAENSETIVMPAIPAYIKPVLFRTRRVVDTIVLLEILDVNNRQVIEYQSKGMNPKKLAEFGEFSCKLPPVFVPENK